MAIARQTEGSRRGRRRSNRYGFSWRRRAWPTGRNRDAPAGLGSSDLRGVISFRLEHHPHPPPRSSSGVYIPVFQRRLEIELIINSRVFEIAFHHLQTPTTAAKTQVCYFSFHSLSRDSELTCSPGSSRELCLFFWDPTLASQKNFKKSPSV